MSPLLDRRTFVSRFVIGTASALLAARPWSARVLGTILSGPAGLLKVKVSDYPALSAEGGSIQLNFSGAAAHPVLINRGAGSVCYTMDSDCQHNHCTVPPYNPALGVIRCGCHGSQYAIDGSLVGGPALRGLNTFTNTFDGVDTLLVTIPGLAFSITEIAIQAPLPVMRLRLTSDILPFSTYRVRFQETLSDAPQTIPFSTTAEGVANLTSAFTRTSSTTVYVDATTQRGFYTVELVATPA
jgi:Rieske Fe-S protein